MEDNEGFILVLDAVELKEGKMKLVSVEGTPILFVKKDCKVFVIDNRCPHQGCGFSGGSLDGLMIVCPCHEWRFNLETGEYENESVYKLKTYEWKTEAGKIWVKLDN